jgi:hypothetical protein
LVWPNSATFSLHSSNMKFNKEKEEWITNYIHNDIHDNTLCFSIFNVQYTDNGKIYKNTVYN